MKPRPIHLLPLVLLAPAALPAATLAHWSFDDPALVGADSSGNGRSLTVQDTVLSATLPATGPGSAFATVSAPNTRAADFGAKAGELRSIDSAFAVSTFTFELLFNATDNTANTYLGSVWNTTSGARSWGVGLAGSATTSITGTPVVANELVFVYSTTGGETNVFSTDLTFSRSNDFYLGVSYDNTAGLLTVHRQDLTAGASLVSTTFDLGVTLFTPEPSVSQFAIGNLGFSATAGNRWSGLIDEVRLSSGVLDTPQLLVAIPEPATTAGLAGFAALTLAALRRRRGGRAPGSSAPC